MSAAAAPAESPAKSASLAPETETAAAGDLPATTDASAGEMQATPAAPTAAERARARRAERREKAAAAKAAKAAAAREAAEAKAAEDARVEAAAQAEATARAEAAATAAAAAEATARAEAQIAHEAEVEAEERRRAAALIPDPVTTDPVTNTLVVEPVVDRVREEPRITTVKEPFSVAQRPEAPPATADVVLSIQRLRKTYGDTVAVDGVSLDVRVGSFYGIAGPNGAGKTTTLSIVTGLVRPDSGSVWVNGVDAWRHSVKVKRTIGVLPDRLRLFDRLTGAQFLSYAGTLRGLGAHTVRERVIDLASAFQLDDALHRLVADYSAGMTKKVALAAALIHSPRLLVLDEPFESVDPVSAANVTDILQRYVAAGGTVVLSSHSMDLIQRVCDSVAIIVNGKVLASGTVDEVRGKGSLEDRFVELAGGRKAAEGLEWLHSFSD